MNARSLIAMATAIALTANVTASEAIKGNSVKRPIVRIPHVLRMDIALRALAFARRAGKEQTARKWIRMHYSVFLTVLDMEHLIWIHRLAPANLDGLARTALENYAIWTAVCMAIVYRNHVNAIPAGQASFVI